MANSTVSIIIKPTATLNRDDTFVFGSWVCVADGTRSFQCYLTKTPNPETGLVPLPEVVMNTLTKNLAKFRSIAKSPTSSLDPPPTRTRRPPGPSHVSRLLSHRLR
jgi:hypothetical protein